MVECRTVAPGAVGSSPIQAAICAGDAIGRHPCLRDRACGFDSRPAYQIPSSKGPGHQAFNLKMRVRFPQGLPHKRHAQQTIMHNTCCILVQVQLLRKAGRIQQKNVPCKIVSPVPPGPGAGKHKCFLRSRAGSLFAVQRMRVQLPQEAP